MPVLLQEIMHSFCVYETAVNDQVSDLPLVNYAIMPPSLFATDRRIA